MASLGDRGVSSRRAQDGEGQLLRELVRSLRSDLNMLSNEAKKKLPAVKEAAERSAMKLKTMSEAKGFSLKVLAESDDVIHPLLFACETKSLTLVKIALFSLQRLIQNKAVPRKSVQSIVATLRVLMVSGVEELKILQTILLLVSVTEVVQGKDLTKVLELCFQLYGSKESSVRNTAGVAIRQIVFSLFERLDNLVEEEGVSAVGGATNQLPTQANDAYLLFQDICFLTNGDPPAWLPGSVDLELSLGLELLEAVLSGHSKVFVKEKLFNQLLTERVCPLVIKLFSPSSKYRHASPSPVAAALLAADKPTFALFVRLLRILNVLIREFFSCLVTQCEIFLSMLVRFLDPDKPQWQRTLAVEVLFSFCNDPYLLKSFCERYDMQEHSSRIFGDIIDALGSCIQHSFTSQPLPVQLPFGITSSSSTSVANNSNSALPSAGGMNVSSGRQLHLFSIRGNNIQVEVLPKSAHTKPIYLEMLDKSDVPLIVEGYPLVVAMNALLYAIKSVSLVICDRITSRATTPPPTSNASDGVKSTMLKSSWSGVLAALALLLDTCADEQTTNKILSANTTYINLCGRLQMTSPRDAFLTSLCKASLPPKYLMSLITQRSKHPEPRKSNSKTGQSSSSETSVTGSPENRAPPSHIAGTTVGGQRLIQEPPRSGDFGARRKLHLSEGSGVGRGGGEGVGSETSGGGGTPTMPVRNLGSGNSGVKEQQQSGLVSVKNLQCMNSLLEIVDLYGNVLDTAWPLLLNALQYIFEIFGLRPLASGGFKQSGIADNSALSLVSVEKKTDISSLTEKLNSLFKSSQKLRDTTVTSMITSLCHLSDNAMASPNPREVGLFPVAALLEMGVANTPQLSLTWTPITTHITKVCSHGDPTLRVFAAEALTTLIRSALETTSKQDIKLMMLSPLKYLTKIPFPDVRQKQLECVAQVLQSTQQSLQSSWPILLDVIRSATDLQSESLVRTGFSSLQLVMADFLPTLPPSCVPVCVEVGGQYGLQKMDINISLTSVGLLWNMADYLYQNRSSLQTSLEALRFDTDKTRQTGQENQTPVLTFYKTLQNPSLPVFDSVWLMLFKYMSELCVDERAAVRKSACQTLFSTLSAHGSLLQSTTWTDVLWQVLFPLLDGVTQATWSASTSSFQTAIMIHHSRDSEQKQWAETQVLVLTGAARLFQSWWPVLVSLSGFEKAWTTFLLSLKNCACNSSSEVSIAAIKSFHIVVDPQSTTSSVADPTPTSTTEPPPDNVRGGQTNEEQSAIWTRAWQAWESVGKQMVSDKLPGVEKFRSAIQTQHQNERMFLNSLPTQAFLNHFLEVFPHVFSHLKPHFTEANLEMLCQILTSALSMPATRDVSPFLVPSSNESLMTSVHKLVLRSLGAVFTEDDIFEPPKEPVEGSLLTKRKSDQIDMTKAIKLNSDCELALLYPRILSQLLDYFSYATKLPDLIAATSGIPPVKLPVMVVNMVPVSVGALCLAVKLYRACVTEKVPLPDNMSEMFLKALHMPLKLKHNCLSPVVWVQSLNALLLILETALPSGNKANSPFWLQLATVLEDFLFNESAEGMNLTPEKIRECEAMDIKVIELLKSRVLTTPAKAPREFLDHFTSILNRGSIHSATDQLDGEGAHCGVVFREHFARVCFEALLQFSFVSTKDNQMAPDSTNQGALKALLVRSEEVLSRFVNDERLSGSCPLPRTRMSEVALVLKSVTILISTLKEARKTSTNIDHSIWIGVARLYPALVQCVTCHSQEVRAALREALHQFTDLIQEQS